MEQNTPMYKIKSIEGKLYLTSQDIKVGDVIKANYWIDKGGKYEMHFEKEGEVIEDEVDLDHWKIKRPDDLNPGKFVAEHSLKSGTFKVIGEISPEAVWVKEGMEFTDEQILFWYYHRSFRDMDFYNETIYTEWEEGEKEKYTLKVHVKCPTCGTFH